MANKKITDLQLIDEVTDTLSIPSDDAIQSYRFTAAQMKTYMQTAFAQLFVPTGTVLDFAGSSAPSGFLLCYGQAVSRTTYAALFAALGTTYGVGDGSTTFNLPDLRGRVAAGKDDMGGTSANRLTSPINGDNLGEAGGSESHTLTTAQMPSHTHVQDSHNHNTLIRNATADVGLAVAASFANAVATSGSGYGQSAASNVTKSLNAATTATNQNTGGGEAHPNVQPTIILNKIIKI